MEDAPAIASVGLCATCTHVRLIRSDREAIFYLCTLSVVNPRFRKYPMLPVLSCAEYEDDGKSVGGGNSER
jgi:hypothetical protein